MHITLQRANSVHWVMHKLENYKEQIFMYIHNIVTVFQAKFRGMAIRENTLLFLDVNKIKKYIYENIDVHYDLY